MKPQQPYDAVASMTWIRRWMQTAGTDSLHPEDLDFLCGLRARIAGWVSTATFLRITIKYLRRNRRQLRLENGNVSARALLLRAKAIASTVNYPQPMTGTKSGLAHGVRMGRVKYAPDFTWGDSRWLVVKAERDRVKVALLEADHGLTLMAAADGDRVAAASSLAQEGMRLGLLKPVTAETARGIE